MFPDIWLQIIQLQTCGYKVNNRLQLKIFRQQKHFTASHPGVYSPLIPLLHNNELIKLSLLSLKLV